MPAFFTTCKIFFSLSKIKIPDKREQLKYVDILQLIDEKIKTSEEILNVLGYELVIKEKDFKGKCMNCDLGKEIVNDFNYVFCENTHKKIKKDKTCSIFRTKMI